MTDKTNLRHNISLREIMSGQNNDHHNRTSLSLDMRIKIVRYYFLLAMKDALKGNIFSFPAGWGSLAVYTRKRKPGERRPVSHAMTKKNGYLTYASIPFRLNDVAEIIWHAPILITGYFDFKAAKPHRLTVFKILHKTNHQYRISPWQ